MKKPQSILSIKRFVLESRLNIGQLIPAVGILINEGQGPDSKEQKSKH